MSIFVNKAHWSIHVQGTPIIMCFSKHSLDTPLFDNFSRPLNFGETNQNLWNDKYDNLQIEDNNNLNSACHN